jgi:hypothetical protein
MTLIIAALVKPVNGTLKRNENRYMAGNTLQEKQTITTQILPEKRKFNGCKFLGFAAVRLCISVRVGCGATALGEFKTLGTSDVAGYISLKRKDLKSSVCVCVCVQKFYSTTTKKKKKAIAIFSYINI